MGAITIKTERRNGARPLPSERTGFSSIKNYGELG